MPESRVIIKKVFINNFELSDAIPLRSFYISKTFNKVSFAKIFFHDGDPAKQDFMLSNDDKYKPGNEIKIKIGNASGQETVFEGIIVRHTIRARQNQPSYLMIEAKDKAIKMTLSRKNAYFLDKNEKEILETVAQPYSLPITFPLTFNPIPTRPIPPMVQYEATDWDFMVSRAEMNGLWVFTDDNKLKIMKPDLTGVPVVVAKYGSNILEFEGEMDARRQDKSYVARAWDFAHQSVSTSNEGTFSFTENGNISSNDIANSFDSEVKLNHTGNLSSEELQSWANAYEMKNKVSKAIGRVKIDGNALVKPGSIITLAGVGDRFNGNVFVTGVLHHYEGAWQTDIQFGWSEEWFYKKENFMEKPASGLLPGVNGLQIGVVTEVTEVRNASNKDIRVKVKCPLISTDSEGIEARVATLSAGSDRGMLFIPEPDDEVIVGFLNDDPRQAIILGYLHNKDTHPIPLDFNEFGFKSLNGLKIILNDDKKSIQIITPQRSLKIDDTAGEIELKDATNSIKLDSQGITIHSNTKITIDCAAGVYIN
jgi:Rhs element Vgr protein